MSETGDLAATAMEEAEVLNNISGWVTNTLAFTSKCYSHAAQFTESKGKDQEN